MMTAELDPNRVHRQPELAALAALDATLMAARAALIAEHPDAGAYGFYRPGPMPLPLIIAVLLVDRAAELRCLLIRYRDALDDFYADCARQTDFPF